MLEVVASSAPRGSTLTGCGSGAVQVEDVPAIVTQGERDVSMLRMSFLGALDSFEFKGERLILRE